MLKLKEIIQQMSPEEYTILEEDLLKNKAKNFLYLLKAMREGIKSEAEIINDLETSSSAFYALKSRLLDKIQSILAPHTGKERDEILKSIGSIASIVTQIPREKALAILQKMELDLLSKGMHHEVLTVYSMLKRINTNPQKQFHYSQAFNKQVAFSLSLEKAYEVQTEFSKAIATYLLSGLKSNGEVLSFLINEIENIYNLNKSIHVLLIRNLMLAQYHLYYFPVRTNENVLKILDETRDLILESEEESIKSGLNYVLNFLYLEYYLFHNKSSSANEYYHKLIQGTEYCFMHNHLCCMVMSLSAFKRFEYQSRIKPSILPNTIVTDVNDQCSVIAIETANAVSLMHNGQHKSAFLKLNNLLNEQSFLGFPKAEIEIKIFMGYLLLIQKEYELADNIIKKAVRKIKSLDQDHFSYMLYLTKIADIELNKEKNEKAQIKIIEFLQLFLFNNQHQHVLLHTLVNEYRTKLNLFEK